MGCKSICYNKATSILFCIKKLDSMLYLTLHMNRLSGEIQKIFNVRQFYGQTHKFDSVCIDNVLEVTENKALKSSGSIIGLTNQDSAFLAWLVTANSMTFIKDITCNPQKRRQ